VIWFGASTSLAKPIYMASMVWPTFSVSVGCCVPLGNWLRTELTLALISVIALPES